MHNIKLLLLSILWLVHTTPSRSETIPPVPKNHITDYSGKLKPATVETLNRQLEQFERDSSNQLMVGLFTKMDSNSSIEDYCQRVFQAWKPGVKGKNNGAILFVFINDRKSRIHVGYGLEPVLTDATTKLILMGLRSYLQKGDFDGAMTAGVDAMIKAAKGEFKGNGSTVKGGIIPVASQKGNGDHTPISVVGFLFMILAALVFLYPDVYYVWRRRNSQWCSRWVNRWSILI
jgi:uncharacterized protein